MSAGGVSSLIQMRQAVEKAICGFSVSWRVVFGAEVYLGAWRWSAWVCAHPLTLAQCLSSKGFYLAYNLCPVCNQGTAYSW